MSPEIRKGAFKGLPKERILRGAGGTNRNEPEYLFHELMKYLEEHLELMT